MDSLSQSSQSPQRLPSPLSPVTSTFSRDQLRNCLLGTGPESVVKIHDSSMRRLSLSSEASPKIKRERVSQGAYAGSDDENLSPEKSVKTADWDSPSVSQWSLCAGMETSPGPDACESFNTLAPSPEFVCRSPVKPTAKASTGSKAPLSRNQWLSRNRDSSPDSCSASLSLDLSASFSSSFAGSSDHCSSPVNVVLPTCDWPDSPEPKEKYSGKLRSTRSKTTGVARSSDSPLAFSLSRASLMPSVSPGLCPFAFPENPRFLCDSPEKSAKKPVHQPPSVKEAKGKGRKLDLMDPNSSSMFPCLSGNLDAFSSSSSSSSSPVQTSLSEVSARRLPKSKMPEWMTSKTVLRGLVVNGEIYPYANVGAGEQHQVIRLLGPNRKITWQTKGGFVSFNSDEVVIRCIHEAVKVNDHSRRHRADMACYALYLERGLAVPRMYIRPDLSLPSELTHPDTFIDQVAPGSSGGFCVVERVEAGFTAEAIFDKTLPDGTNPNAPSLAAIAVNSPRTYELIQFALSQWKEFVRFMARKAEPPYVEEFPSGIISKFGENTALFNDFKPDNIGRNANGFLHLDVLKPVLAADNLLYKSLNQFVRGNKQIFDEILRELFADPALVGICGSQARLSLFQSSLGLLLNRAREADYRHQYVLDDADNDLTPY